MPSICSICRESFETAPEKPVAVIDCGHVFHTYCIREWHCKTRIQVDGFSPELAKIVVNMLKCPICKAVIQNPTFRRTFLSFDEAISAGGSEKSRRDDFKTRQLLTQLEIRNAELDTCRTENKKLIAELEAKRKCGCSHVSSDKDKIQEEKERSDQRLTPASTIQVRYNLRKYRYPV